METFIPILIAIVVFAFQAYANFQKEQEKARKRNLGQPPVPPLPEENADRTPVKPRTEIKRQTVAPPQRQAQPIREAYESYSGFMDTDKVTRTQKAARNPIRSSSRIEVEEDADSAYARDEMTFDLRDAVIKSAILERPYP